MGRVDEGFDGGFECFADGGVAVDFEVFFLDFLHGKFVVCGI